MNVNKTIERLDACCADNRTDFISFPLSDGANCGAVTDDIHRLVFSTMNALMARHDTSMPPSGRPNTRLFRIMED